MLWIQNRSLRSIVKSKWIYPSFYEYWFRRETLLPKRSIASKAQYYFRMEAFAKFLRVLLPKGSNACKESIASEAKQCFWMKALLRKGSIASGRKHMEFRVWRNLPRMYIIVKQLSKANPTKNRQRVNCQKFVARAVKHPAMQPTTLHPTSAGILPYLSAMNPKINPPKMAPTKNMLWEIVGNAASSQTQSYLINNKNMKNSINLMTW